MLTITVDGFRGLPQRQFQFNPDTITIIEGMSG